MPVKTNGNESGFVAVIVLIVIVVLVFIGVSSLFKNNPEETKADTKTVSSVATQIQADKNIDICVYKDNRTEYLTTGKALEAATTNFVNLAHALDRDVCKTFQYGLFIPATSANGETSSTSVLTLRVDEDNRNTFDNFDWDSAVDQEIGAELQDKKILTKFNANVSGINIKDVRFAGKSEEFK